MAEDKPQSQINETVKAEEVEKQFPNLAKLFTEKQYVGFTPEQFETFQKSISQPYESLSKSFNDNFAKVMEAVNKPRQESVPSSPAGGMSGVNKETQRVAEWLISKGGERINFWNLNKDEYIEKWRLNYRRAITEAVTSTNVPGILFDRDVLLIPGGQAMVNIRPYVNYKTVGDTEDTFHWHKLDKITFAAITAGSTISASSQTASRIAGTVNERGALQKIGFNQQRSLPFDLVNAVNDTFVAASLHDESSLVLEQPATGTAGDITAANWIKGSDGSEITADDTASVTLKFDGMNKAVELLETQGYNKSSFVAFLHPRAYAELISDAVETLGLDPFGSGILESGQIERYLGVKIVPTTAVYLKDNATTDAYRNIMCVSGTALGLASRGSVEVEADRRIEESQIFATGRHYIASKVLESTAYVRISTSAA